MLSAIISLTCLGESWKGTKPGANIDLEHWVHLNREPCLHRGKVDLDGWFHEGRATSLPTRPTHQAGGVGGQV